MDRESWMQAVVRVAAGLEMEGPKLQQSAIGAGRRRADALEAAESGAVLAGRRITPEVATQTSETPLKARRSSGIVIECRLQKP
jgi:hypothetical protein